MATAIKSQPIKWHGGKSYLADWIISLMPPHLHYVEPFFGGGAVLLARDPTRDWFIDQAWKLKNGDRVPAHFKGCSEVVNDLNSELTNFWSMLRGGEEWWQLQDLLRMTPFSAIQFKHVVEAVTDYKNETMPEVFSNHLARAWWFFIRNRQSRQGLGKDFATLSRNRTRGRRNEQANSWLSAIEGLEEIHERLRAVVILNDDAKTVIKQQDGEHTLFYCDPPYLHETRTSTGEYGQQEMTAEDHWKLLTALSTIKGCFMLSGYHSEMYDEWAETKHWNCHEKVIDNKASSAKVKKKQIECVWTNY